MLPFRQLHLHLTTEFYIFLTFKFEVADKFSIEPRGSRVQRIESNFSLFLQYSPMYASTIHTNEIWTMDLLNEKGSYKKDQRSEIFTFARMVYEHTASVESLKARETYKMHVISIEKKEKKF